MMMLQLDILVLSHLKYQLGEKKTSDHLQAVC